MLKLAMKESESCDNYNFENLIVSFDEFVSILKFLRLDKWPYLFVYPGKVVRSY
jgi:hypothetical protein